MANINTQPAPLWRRLCAMIYDGFILIALWFATTAAYIALCNFLFHTHPSNHLILQLTLFPLLLASTFFFFYYFWKKKGQTLGMLAWRLHLNSQETPVTLKTALIRWSASVLSLGCFGLGYAYALFRKDKLSWHDRVSNTWVIYLPAR